MYIEKDVYNRIVFDTPKPPPETGGAIFQKNGVVSRFVFDSGLCEYSKYTPDVDFLNHQIKQFAEKGYEFCGLFHSHFPFGENLSDDDKRYIEIITLSLKNQIKELYFPVVLPNDKLISYCSYIKDGKVIIVGDKLFII